MNEQSIGELSDKVVSVWAWWQAALKDPAKIGKDDLTVSESDPQHGYFRVRRKDGPWEPVAIWQDQETGEWIGYRNGQSVSEVHALWVWACRQPVTYEAYEQAMDGKGWDDEPDAAPSIGHNSGEADPFDAMKIELLGEIEMAESFMAGGIKTQSDADKVGIWTNKIRRIGKNADDLRKVEKQPHLDAGRNVDAKWKELTDAADAVVRRLKDALAPFLKEQRRLEQERQERERLAAEQLRREEEQRRREAEQQAQSDPVVAEQEEQRRREADKAIREAQRAAEERKVHAGRTGAKVGLRIEKRGQITDQDAFYGAVRERAEVTDLLKSLANSAAKSGFELPGMKIIEEERVV